MPYDFQLDLQTGDWNFDSLRDVSGVTANDLITQRIFTRLKIQKGTYIFDRSGNMGSNLGSTFAKSIPKGKQSIELFVREALAPMQDIVVDDVNVLDYRDDPSVSPGELRTVIYWHPTSVDTISDDSASVLGASSSIILTL